MRWMPFSMPDGWPVSLWFFVITAIVYLLQRFPLTGVFLMILGGAFWSILLINLGMAGVVLESITGKVSFLWLLLPALYLGGYYWAYFNDQRTLEAVTAETAGFNEGKSLPFDPFRQDLVIGDPKDGLGIRAAEFSERFGLERVFDGNGRMYLIGTAESCELLRDKPVFLSAGIQSYAITRRGPSTWNAKSTGFCTIMMPGKPDRSVVRIAETEKKTSRGRLPLTTRDFTARDDSTGTSAIIRTVRAGPLKRFPMPVMGCALNSGAPSWECFHGFMRDTVDLPPGRPRYSGGAPLVAALLGLEQTDDLAPRAIGPERFKPMADRADAELAAKELAVLESVLADPFSPQDSWLRHLPNRPDLIAPYAARIFDALGKLQSGDRRGNIHGRNLWRLVAILPEPALAPHRAQMVEWMKPGALREWTDDAWQIYSRLDVADPVQRDIVLSRLENKNRGDLQTTLLPAFCRMGASAPQDVKDRLLGVWRARGELARDRKSGRGHGEEMLYLALARMGVKEHAGKVEQHYMGPTYAAIWEQVGPDSPADICDLSPNDLRNHFRRR